MTKARNVIELIFCYAAFLDQDVMDLRINNPKVTQQNQLTAEATEML